MKRIFLIEDDLDDQETFLIALGNLEALVACETAVNGADALAQLRADQLKPDLIFLDLRMPDMHGHQFMNQLKLDPDLKSIPVVIITDSSDPLDREMSKLAGAKKFITKPEDPVELEKEIADCVKNYA